MLHLVVTAFFCLMPYFAQAEAYDFVDNGLYYKITSTNTVKIVQNTSYQSLRNELIIPGTVIYQNKSYEVTAIDEYCFRQSKISVVTLPNTLLELGNFAFNQCTLLQSISLPVSLVDIGASAFSGCIKLTSITIPDKVTKLKESVFYGCSALQTVTLPNSLKSIGGSAFNNCKKLVSISIPDSVKSMGYGAFSGCSELTSVKLSSQLVSVYDRTFSGCSKLESIDLPNSVQNIGYYAFNGCTSLTYIKFSRCVKAVFNNAFDGCSSLESIELGDSLVTIGTYAFVNCSSLHNVEFSPTTETIGKHAFQNCINLSSISLPDSIKLIDDFAFKACSSLSTIDFPNTVFTIGEDPFDGTPWLNNLSDGLIYIGSMAFKFKGTMEQGSHFSFREGTNYICAGCFQDCSWLGSIDIPSTITAINPNTFNGCTSLHSINLPSTITSIGNYAFKNCSSLTSISLPTSLTEIGEEAFGYCTGLTSVTLPESLTQLNGFQFCSNLTSVNIKGRVTSVYGFRGCTSLTSIHLPSTVNYIADMAFYNCSALNDITCAATNPPYAIEENPKYADWGSFSGVNKATCVVTVPENSISNYHIAEGWREFSHLQAIINDNISGDVNGDGVVDIADVNGVINGMLGKADIVLDVNDVKFGMVKVVGGTFEMGLDYDEDLQYYCISAPSPKHAVTLNNYFISSTEVTQELYHAVMGGTPNTYEETIPITGLSWNACNGFITRLNERTGLSFRLPTEAEWEYAARGGNKSNGYFYSGSNNCGDVGYCAGDYTLDTPLGPWPVAQRKPNELGIYDMSGNVWEWCQDWFGPYPNEAQTNPQGPETGTQRVIRGGSCYNPVEFYCNVYNRASCIPSQSTPSGMIEHEPIGIRLVMDTNQSLINNALDVTGDGVVDISDVNAVINIMLGNDYDIPTGHQGHDTAPGKEE